MEVKTNREYHAMQHEIETAQGEVKRVEDQMLELMVAADDLSATLKSAETSLKKGEQDVTRERADLDRQHGASDAVLEETTAERRTLAAQISPNVLEQYEIVAKGRRGIAVAEARAERCTECHVRLRPMIYSEVRHNKTLVQCDSCQRFLYYVPPPAEGASASAGPPRTSTADPAATPGPPATASTSSRTMEASWRSCTSRSGRR